VPKYSFSIGPLLPSISRHQVKLGGIKMVNGRHLLSSAQLGSYIGVAGVGHQLAHNTLLLAEYFGYTERNESGRWRLTPKGLGLGQMYNGTVVWYPLAIKHFLNLNLYGGPLVQYPQALPPIPPTKPE